MAAAVNDETVTDALWVLTKTGETVCAVNSANVQAIFRLQEEVTGMPDSDDVHLGIVKFRGAVLPIVDLRCLMGMKSRTVEAQEFEQMLDLRKQDHVRWVDELKRCLRTGDTFTLTTNPHECAFGRWYDNYHSESHSVAFQLQMIDEPHKKLHASALDAFTCTGHGKQAQGSQEADRVVKEGAEVYMNQVLTLLDETKRVFRQSYHKMVVVLAQKGCSLGVMVDEVLAVEPLTDIAQQRLLTLSQQSPLVAKVAQRATQEELVLVLNEQSLFGDQIVARQAQGWVE